VNINITQSESLIDKGKAQVIEAIAEEKAATFTVKLASQQNKEFSNQNKVMRLPQEMSSIEELFRTINSHTLKLVESEIKFWKKERIIPFRIGIMSMPARVMSSSQAKAAMRARRNFRL
jgi:hypothetical protein